MFSGLTNGVLGTSYTSEDSDLVAVENNYAALENGLQSEIVKSINPPNGSGVFASRKENCGYRSMKTRDRDFPKKILISRKMSMLRKKRQSLP